MSIKKVIDMKRNGLLLAFLFSIAFSARCDNVYLFEQFDDDFLPYGWSVSGIGNDYWWIANSNHAGGTPNELQFYCNEVGTWRVISPAVDLSGLENLNVSFKHYYAQQMGANLTIGIATSSDNGAHWHQGWSHTYTASGRYEVNEEITTEDMGKNNVKICIFFSNSNDMNFSELNLDDIAAFVQRDLDIEVQGINVDAVQANRSFEVGMRLFNTGSDVVTSVEGYYQFDDQDPVSQTFNVNIPGTTFENLTFEIPANLVPDTYTLTTGITKVNGVDDDDLGNNSKSQTVSVACATVQRLPMFEHFTSSTCGTCPQLSAQMQTFCNNNPGKYTYIKYQMNWPPPGDPYYTGEGGTRKTYYGVNAVPWLFMDGVSYEFNPVTQSDFDAHFNTPAVVEIKGSYFVEGNTIHVAADLMAFADMNDVRVYVSVSEKTTHNNVGNNGETSFHHVMMKMLPNAQGTTLSLKAGELHSLDFEQNMANTHVEEMDDLEVAVWIQKYETKRVFNSNFLFATDRHPYMPENLKLEKNATTLTATWDAPSGNAPTGYNIWLNETLVAENANGTSRTFDIVPGQDFYCVQVQAVYGDGITSVKAVATDSETWSLNETTENTISLYPNPASEIVSLQGMNPVEAQIYNCLGQLVLTLDHPKEIQVAQLPNGLYVCILKEENQNQKVTKFIVNH